MIKGSKQGIDGIEKLEANLNRLAMASNLQMEGGKIRGQGVGTRENLVRTKTTNTQEEADLEERYVRSRLEGEGEIEHSEDEIIKIAQRAAEEIIDKFLNR